MERLHGSVTFQNRPLNWRRQRVKIDSLGRVFAFRSRRRAAAGDQLQSFGLADPRAITPDIVGAIVDEPVRLLPGIVEAGYGPAITRSSFGQCVMTHSLTRGLLSIVAALDDQIPGQRFIRRPHRGGDATSRRAFSTSGVHRFVEHFCEY